MHAHTEETISLRRCAVRSIAVPLALHLLIFSSLHSSLAREPLRWEKGLAPCPPPRKGRSLTFLFDSLEKCLCCVLASGESLVIPSID